MIVCQTVLIFVLFSFLGWLWETVYCTIKHGNGPTEGFSMAVLSYLWLWWCSGYLTCNPRVPTRSSTERVVASFSRLHGCL